MINPNRRKSTIRIKMELKIYKPANRDDHENTYARSDYNH
jgi:hypothetical protein